MTADNRASRPDSRTRLLDAALNVVRSKGLTATRVEDVCAAAGVTKGSFFHHFKSKDDLMLAAVAHWDAMTTDFFASADYHRHADPLDRVLAYVDFRRAILQGDLPEFTCFVGTIIQEAYRTHPDIVAACERCVLDHAQALEPDIAEAMRVHGTRVPCTARDLALHTQAVIQGGFILAKAVGSAKPVADSLAHLRRYLQFLFHTPDTAEQNA